MRSGAPHWLFSYGTLRRAAVQRELFGRLLDGRPDSLAGFVLATIRVGGPAAGGGAEYPILRRGGAADIVAGTALAMTDADLAAADGYETDDYVRIAVTLASGRPAFVYVARDA